MQVRITPSKIFAPDLKGRITRPQVPVTSPEFDGGKWRKTNLAETFAKAREQLRPPVAAE